MKNQAMAVMVAAILLLSASGETLAAGKLGGAGGADEFLLPPPMLAGKLGGSSGADELLLAASGSTLGGIDVVGKTRLFGGKLGGAGGMDEFVQSDPDEVSGCAVDGDLAHPVALGGKVGGGMDRPVALGSKLGTHAVLANSSMIRLIG